MTELLDADNVTTGRAAPPLASKWPQLAFNQAAFQNLSPHDQELFETYGQGPVRTLPFDQVHEAFEFWVKHQPDAVAVEWEGRSTTYCQLNRGANLLANRLLEEGVTPGDKVALFLRRSTPMVVGIMASLKVGAAYAPQHIGVAPLTQLEFVLDATEANVILTMAEFADQLPERDGVTIVEVDTLLSEPALQDELNGTDVTTLDLNPAVPGLVHGNTCFVLFTSGTTGNPNGVQVTHQNVCNILLTEPGNLGMRPGLKVSQILSIAFDMAAWETLGSMMNGATLLVRGKSIQETVERADIVIATPSVLGSVDASRCPNVKVAAVAGEPCPRPLADTWSQFATFYNSCGPTETTIVNTAQNYTLADGGLSIGAPTPNNTVYVLDENRQPLPIGDVGEMWAGGKCVTGGYLKNKKLTDERYVADPFLGDGNMMFRTRDLGRWNENGELEHYGRTDDQVKVRGFRVELDSVSAMLERTEDCTAAVTLKLDSRNLVAFVQPASVDADAARREVLAALPYYCEPALVTPLEALPRTSRGKIDKRLLLAAAARAFARGSDIVTEADFLASSEGISQ